MRRTVALVISRSVTPRVRTPLTLLFPVLLLLAVRALGLSVVQPRVESLDHPLGIDVAAPRFSWVLQAEERGVTQRAYHVLVASSPELLAQERGDVWDSGKVASAESFGIVYAASALRTNTVYFWKVRVWDAQDRASAWSDVAQWSTGLLADADWTAKWISPANDTPSPWLRKGFRAEKPLRRATAFVVAMGWYRLRLNGHEAGDLVLAPVNSNYTKNIYYDTYDVTALVQRGDNALGLWLGNGYNDNYSKWGYRWQAPKQACLQLELEFEDGTKARVVTDESWRTAESPITANHIYNGETYDARRESEGWDRAGFDDQGWSAAVVREAPKTGRLRSRLMPPIRVVATQAPVSVRTVRPGVYVYDFGQNFAGWVRLKAQGPAGATITLRHAENLHPDGTLDPTTNRAAVATDAYTLRGRGVETYEPSFTYHGFRYVEVSGYPGVPALNALEGRVVRSAVVEGGGFRSSNMLLNRIHQNFRWSVANNLMGIPTDTASRDERTPCSMDSMAVEETAIYNFDMNQYYTKWLEDTMGDVGSAPNWAGDVIVLPMLLWEYYGDRRALEANFANMKKVADEFLSQADKPKLWAGGFGDWCPPRQPGDYETSFSEGEIVNRAFHVRCLEIVTETATLLGATEDVAKYEQAAATARQRFNEQLFDPANNTYGSGRQVTSVLPLAFGLVPEAKRQAVATALAERVRGVDEGHLDTGIFGTRYLFDVLMDHGHADLALGALTATTHPGYGFQIGLGATTTWEQWPFRGGMQSHDHAMFSGPDATLYSRLGGIRPASPGFRTIEIRPVTPSGLSFVNVSTRTIVGEIASAWERGEQGYRHRVSIPANTTATVFVPAASAESVREGKGPASEAAGVRYLRQEDGYAVFAVGSGEYEFSVNK